MGGLSGDRQRVPKAKHSAQRGQGCKGSLRSPSTPAGVGCLLRCLAVAGFG